MSELTISAKSLGELAMPGFCARCFWIKMHAGKLPFQIFPGIFSSIDAYTKKIVHGYFDGHGCFPAWLAGLGDLVAYREPLHYSKYKYRDDDSGLTLWGTPDGIFTRRDGSHVIVDYKTAKYTGNQDKLMPMYGVQLNAYAAIGHNSGQLSPVSGLALIYMEPVTHNEAASADDNQRGDGFAMGFAASIHAVELRPDSIPALLARVRDIYELPAPPEANESCRDCASLNNLIEVALRK
jgi:hypothetical protein